ncbi:MAG: hypothetical protein RBG1_1C00001G1698 [candidate division Zixibacteria bacterium RBG-1]|nr:MAG: hypothetical protein RBG1_1C00001G1698 [candidate division Zixibacteria bacterium RBG-1]OGC86092.1 MAG: pyridoxal-5'-phosphate-dependent protein subunit beta [candidate division Zixibacteria bacterium RBG_19FT_COMBO_42_43]
MKFYPDVLKVIGNTPLIKLTKVVGENSARVFAKAEFLNPSGSVKDRMALYIIEKAEKEGLLKPGGTIVENTSGNTGAAVAMVAALKGYKAIFTMPDKMSTEKINLLKAFGAKVIVTPTNVPADSPLSYYETAKRIARETPNSFYLNQYHNPLNIEAHYLTTGPEIWEQTQGELDYLVAGIGTGGTLSGAAKYLKEKNPKVKIIAVDPIGSVFYQYFKTGKLPQPHVYKVEGIGEDMLTGAMDFSVVDEIYQVSDQQSFLMTRKLTRQEGLFVGGSSGSAAYAALELAKKVGKDKIIVVILPDSGSRYLSKIYSDEWMKDNSFLLEEKAPTQIGKIKEVIKIQKRLITAQKKDKVEQVIAKMKRYDISQLPVLEGKKVVGLIAEVDLLKYMLDGKRKPKDSIANLIETDFIRVSLNSSITEVSQLLSSANSNAALVMEKDKLLGIVTKIDIVDFLAKKFKGR